MNVSWRSEWREITCWQAFLRPAHPETGADPVDTHVHPDVHNRADGCAERSSTRLRDRKQGGLRYDDLRLTDLRATCKKPATALEAIWNLLSFPSSARSRAERGRMSELIADSNRPGDRNRTTTAPQLNWREENSKQRAQIAATAQRFHGASAHS